MNRNQFAGLILTTTLAVYLGAYFYHTDQPQSSPHYHYFIIGEDEVSEGFEILDESWYNPRYTHTMSEALPNLWHYGNKTYAIRDLMGRKI